MSPEDSLEGWVPVITGELPLARVIELAFDYRGNVTILEKNGAQVIGYIFNRNAKAPEPEFQYFDTDGGGPFTLKYSHVSNICFTGKDMAAGASWEAWQTKRNRQ